MDILWLTLTSNSFAFGLVVGICIALLAPVLTETAIKVMSEARK